MYKESGIGRYIRNLISCLQIIDKSNEYFILHLRDDYDILEYHNNFRKLVANFRWYGLTEQIKMPRILQSIMPDLVHFPHFNVPIFYKGKFVVTIHDLIHQNFSMKRATTHGPFVYKIKQFGYRRVFQSAIEKSEAILVPSNFVKQQLVKDWQIDDDKMAVTHEAVDNKLFAIVKKMNQKKIADIMQKLRINTPYIFYVGNAHPHKNVEGLIKVFLVVKKHYPNLKLVLAGNDHYFWQRIKSEFQQPGIIYTGYIDDEQLIALYKNAELFVMPSFEEGFGIPILEAMVCSCPVVSSNAGSLPEVGGDAPLYFNPTEPDDMVEKILKILDNQTLRNQIIEKGLKRVKVFSWQKLAKKTMEVYESCFST